MNEEIQTLRNRLRLSLYQSRQIRKEVFVDRKRTEFAEHDGTQLNEAEVTNTIRKLKKQGAIESKELEDLRIYLSNTKNIPLFFKHYGSLQGLVGELTGADTDKQYLAGQCLCHLTLGTKYNCLAIVRAAGVYLITLLTGQDLVFADLSCLILCNLVNSSPKASHTLQEQGLITSLIHVISNKRHSKIRIMALVALSNFLRSSPSLLKMAEYIQIIEIMSDFSQFTMYQARMLFVISANSLCFTPAFYPHRLFTKMSQQLVVLVHRNNWDENLPTVIYALRFMANTIWDNSVAENERDALTQESFVCVLKKLLVCQRKVIIEVLLWFFGNIENHSCFSLQWKLNYLGQFSDLIAMCIP